jgi:hypothetical protein
MTSIVDGSSDMEMPVAARRLEVVPRKMAMRVETRRLT